MACSGSQIKIVLPSQLICKPQAAWQSGKSCHWWRSCSSPMDSCVAWSSSSRFWFGESGLKVPSGIKSSLKKFSDASEKVYAAVIYARATYSLGNVTTNLLTSKTKLALVKTVSLPRLELCGAFLGPKLRKTTSQVFEVANVNSKSMYASADSSIALHSLTPLPRTWNTFVANRVSHIQEIGPREFWKHCPTKENPVNLASRGVSVHDLKDSNPWWTRPFWPAQESEFRPEFHLSNFAVVREKDQQPKHQSRKKFLWYKTRLMKMRFFPSAK